MRGWSSLEFEVHRKIWKNAKTLIPAISWSRPLRKTHLLSTSEVELQKNFTGRLKVCLCWRFLIEALTFCLLSIWGPITWGCAPLKSWLKDKDLKSGKHEAFSQFIYELVGVKFSKVQWTHLLRRITTLNQFLSISTSETLCPLCVQLTSSPVFQVNTRRIILHSLPFFTNCCGCLFFLYLCRWLTGGGEIRADV